MGDNIKDITMEDQQENSRNAKPWTKSELDYIKANYIFRDKNSIAKIASELSRSRKAVRHAITKLGITNIENVKKYQDCSMKIKHSTPETAYILGVYLSDGWTHKDVFELSSIDREYCEEVIRCLEAILIGEFNKTIREYSMDKINQNKQVKYTSNLYKIRVRSTDLATWLRIITNSKQTIPQEFIENNPKELLSGLMDGDGSISISKARYDIKGSYKITLCGHGYIYQSVQKYPKIFAKLNIRYTETNPKTESVGFVIYNLNKADFVNSGCEFKILRKREKLNKLREILNEYHGTSKEDDGIL